MFNFTVKCKGAQTVIGEFLGWHQLEALVAIQCNDDLWNWFENLIQFRHLIEVSNEHFVTTASNGMTVVYGIEAQQN